MRTRQTLTISLPPEMVKQVEATMRAEHRTRSELVREALRIYIAIRRFSNETATPAELRAIRRGRADFAHGDYLSLDELRREEAVARRPRRTRAKVS
ncbi:MAG: ribbon-helix-helix domain-containing protein [Terriglobia bacterium]